MNIKHHFNMPIAICYTNGLEITTEHADSIVKYWADDIQIDIDDITLNLVKLTHQAGKSYNIMVNLFLPSLLSKTDIEIIQRSLANTLNKCLGVSVNDVFVITTVVDLGNVFDRGATVTWKA